MTTTKKIDVECKACGHVTSVVAGAPAYRCDGCKGWNANPEGQAKPDPEAAAMERARAFKAMQKDDKPEP